jgi:hypothetical protein
MSAIVKEFKTVDGLGAMLWKKLYAMCYAYEKGLLFEDTEVLEYIVHPSDMVYEEKDVLLLSKSFFSIINNPWENIDFKTIPFKKICEEAGEGFNERAQAGINYRIGPSILLNAPVFNLNKNKNNNIVIHIRRSNATEINPRYTGDEFYFNVLKQIPEISRLAGLSDPEVIICTDAPDKETMYKPVNEFQQNMWNQPFLERDQNGFHLLKSIEFDLYREILPNIKFVNNLGPVDSMTMMLEAGVLIVANSSFSQSAGLLSNNNVIGTHPHNGINPLYNNFKNRIAGLDHLGNLIT